MELLTMAEIARRLDLPESTVRYYRDRFSEFIPSVGDGRTRRYKPEALEVLRLIADAMRAGIPAENVTAALRDSFPVNADIEPQQQTATTQQQTAAAIADALRNLGPALIETKDAIAALRNELREYHEQSATAIEDADRRHEETLKRLNEQHETQLNELKQWLESKVTPAEAKRLGLAARMRALLRRDRI
jgi:DNA-binding transcriptional MerR regulator